MNVSSLKNTDDLIKNINENYKQGKEQNEWRNQFFELMTKY